MYTGLRLSFALAAAFSLSACWVPSCNFKKKASADEKSAKVEEDEPAEAPAKSAETPAAPANTGKFVYVFKEAESPELKKYGVLFEKGRFPALIEAMNVFNLPRDVRIVAAQCGEANAVYMPKQHGIKVCYELADAFYKAFRKELADQPAATATANSLTFTLLHEMGHALINELELGVSGGEEDAVDELAALILIQNKKPDWAVQGTQGLAAVEKNADTGKPKYFDEHSLPEQRYANVMCMVYGSDPEGRKDVMETVPELRKRAAKCPTDYARKDKDWTQKLAPFQKKK